MSTVFRAVIVIIEVKFVCTLVQDLAVEGKKECIDGKSLSSLLSTDFITTLVICYVKYSIKSYRKREKQ